MNDKSERSISNEEILHHFYPNKESLVLNALIECLNDNEVSTQRQVLDFLITHLPINKELLLFNVKTKLIQAACYLILNNNETVLRKLYTWMPRKSGEELVMAVKKCFERVPKDLKTAITPIKIVKMINVIPEVCLTIIQYLEKYRIGYCFSQELILFSKDVINNKTLDFIWEAIDKEYSDIIKVMNLIYFLITTYNSTNSKALITIFNKALISFHTIKDKLCEDAIILIRVIRSIVGILDKELLIQNHKAITEGIDDLTSLLTQLITSTENEVWDKEQCFELITEVILKLQEYSKCDNPKWLQILIEHIKTSNNLIYIDTLLKYKEDNTIVHRLWEVVDKQSDYKSFIKLFEQYEYLKEELFLFVEEELVKGKDIARFMLLWKLLGGDKVSKLSIFYVIDNLKCENPQTRNLTQEWLCDYVEDFNSILDPIISSILANNNNNKEIVKFVKRIKNIIEVVRERFINFVSNTEISFELDKNASKINSSKKLKKVSYMKLLMVILLEKSNNDIVTSVQCYELINILISSIESLELIQEIVSFIIKPLLNYLKDKKDDVIQIEILKIFSIIQVKAIYNAQYADNCFTIFQDYSFIEAILRGLDNKHKHTISFYIEYLKSILHLIPIFMQEKAEEFIVRVIKRLNAHLLKDNTYEVIGMLKIMIDHYVFGKNVRLSSEEKMILENCLSIYKIRKLKSGTIKSSILNLLKDLFISFLRIWDQCKNELVCGITSIGVLSVNVKQSLESLELNSMQELIMSILTPLLKKYTDKVIKALLSIWILKHEANNIKAMQRIVSGYLTSIRWI